MCAVRSNWCCLLLAFVGMAPGCRVARAQQAPLLLPSAVAYDSAGDLFFVDTNRNQVFEVALSGALTTVAGTGVQGFAGDGGAAAGAELNAPQGVAVGPDGTVYVADTGNERIRSIVNGQMATVAGTGVRGYSGDNGAASAAMLSLPTGLAVGLQGDLLVCDTGNERVRRVAAGVITTVAGNGVQGFAGDGGAATAAELDSPAGVAVASDGRTIVADTHNERLRVIAGDGVIETMAGTGVAGYTGDGGPATAAEVSLPRGVSVDAAGDVLFADADNQRIRMIGPQGVISTVAGSGIQGFAADKTDATAGTLNTPRAVGVSSFGSPVFADTANRLVREVAANGEVYTVAVLAAPRTSVVTLTAPGPMVYGQSSTNVAVAGSVATAQGSVTLLDGGAALATANLSGGTAAIGLASLAAGGHTLTASYAGDGLNPAAMSSPVGVSVSPAQVTATANGVAIVYGQAIPALTGVVSGVLPQDVAQVSVNFATTAVALDPVGSYPITASLSGSASGNYSLAMSAQSGAVQIAQAQSTIALQPVAQSSYAGLPLLLTADLGSVTSGIPTGEVEFLDGGTVVATVRAVNGVASATELAPALGMHTFTASYGGDGNFVGSSSAAVTSTISAMPDFSLAAGAQSQTVQGGLIASFPIAVSSQGGAFTGGVNFSVSGLQPGAMASFSPPVVVPGTTGATVTVSIQTVALAGVVMPGGHAVLWCFGAPLLFLFRRRMRGFCRLPLVLSVLLLGCLGCGARTVSDAEAQSQSYTLTITGTATNLAGAVVAHTATVVMTVE